MILGKNGTDNNGTNGKIGKNGTLILNLPNMEKAPFFTCVIITCAIFTNNHRQQLH